jgi:hypothetical protein
MHLDVPLVAETMSVFHDDGVRYASHIQQDYANGGSWIYDPDIMEDGSPNTVGSGPCAMAIGNDVCVYRRDPHAIPLAFSQRAPMAG